jgi:hypothetical protein
VETQSGRSERVGRDLTPAKASPHETWPKVLKWFLIMRYATRHLFPSWRSNQNSWELLLTTNYEGGRFPEGRTIPHGVDPKLVFEMAKADAEKWKGEGSKADFL